jgi:hypothetical protein
MDSPSCLNIIAHLPTTHAEPLGFGRGKAQKIVLWRNTYIYMGKGVPMIQAMRAFNWKEQEFDFFQCLRDLKERDKQTP